MTVALIDNGSLEPAAHRNLRAVAAELSARCGVTVHAVSWKHSDRLQLAVLDNAPAWTLAPWLRAHFAAGERDFVFVPFFISAQGAIGSALRGDLEKLQHALGDFSFSFTEGLAARGALPGIVADRVRTIATARGLARPAVILVDHGGPSAASAELRDQVAFEVRASLGTAAAALAAASMEGAEYAHNRPLLADLLATPPFARGEVVIAPLFLSPGRHAGPRGDLAAIAREAEGASAGALRCHFADLVGTHPLAVDALAAALRHTLDSLPAENLAVGRALRPTSAAIAQSSGINPDLQPV